MASRDSTITQALLNDLFLYNNGNLYWKKTRGRAIQGAVAGYKHSSGYIIVETHGKLHKAHRLIWLMHYGSTPEFLDHINGNRADNRIENLRPATKTENNQNMKMLSSNTSGVKGVHWQKNANKWRVQIRHNNKRKHIGYFDDIELAALVASEARVKYHGIFARDI